ncbi:hypothetical protein BAZOLSSOX_1341 [uncultured Gammaproteobacteria bacterium]|nr:hypothetical protein BAZOLSSOX_1341 [uncultured Gammaproteobacteria bacterium]
MSRMPGNSPPHRWLRKLQVRFFHCGEYSPPHRWLRKLTWA